MQRSFSDSALLARPLVTDHGCIVKNSFLDELLVDDVTNVLKDTTVAKAQLEQTECANIFGEESPESEGPNPNLVYSNVFRQNLPYHVNLNGV